eukprot:762411-Hanusia_phi.AAC.1
MVGQGKDRTGYFDEGVGYANRQSMGGYQHVLVGWGYFGGGCLRPRVGDGWGWGVDRTPGHPASCF